MRVACKNYRLPERRRTQRTNEKIKETLIFIENNAFSVVHLEEINDVC